MKSKWEIRLKVLRFQDRLNNAFDESGKKFNHEVEELLEEIGTELQLIARLGGENFNFNQQSSINFKDMLRIGRNLLAIAATIGTLFAVPPLGIVMAIGTIVSVITGFFKSKKEKQREAAENIRKSLTNQLEDYQQKVLTLAQEEFKKYCDTIAVNINNYFEELIQCLEKISEQLITAKNKLDSSANYLNSAYAIAASNTWVKQLIEIRQDFELILRYINKATKNPVI
ncbi:hypothetical protein [Iningainema tapete]|uniref:hypothetical protein n=1 Tax=Iningainema tapete TaxID=2806730 RepID=UPI001EE297A8|nr:hypothetical protein [Iningainema tapete]